MSTHAKLTGKHQYVEFKEETVAKRVKKMLDLRPGDKVVVQIRKK